MIEIKKRPGYQVGEGETAVFHPLLEDAQRDAIGRLFPDDGVVAFSKEAAAHTIVAHAAEVVAILSPGPELRVRETRKDKGTKRGPRKLKAQPAVQPEGGQ